MEKILTKKKVLATSVIMVVILLLWNYVGNYRICDLVIQNGAAGSCPRTLAGVGVVFFPFFPLFLLSLLTYFMREEVFRTWVRFAAWWVPLSMVLIFITPTEHGGWSTPGLLDPGFAAFILSALFLIISLLIVIGKAIAVHDKK